MIYLCVLWAIVVILVLVILNQKRCSTFLRETYNYYYNDKEYTEDYIDDIDYEDVIYQYKKNKEVDNSNSQEIVELLLKKKFKNQIEMLENMKIPKSKLYNIKRIQKNILSMRKEHFESASSDVKYNNLETQLENSVKELSTISISNANLLIGLKDTTAKKIPALEEILKNTQLAIDKVDKEDEVIKSYVDTKTSDVYNTINTQYSSLVNQIANKQATILGGVGVPIGTIISTTETESPNPNMWQVCDGSILPENCVYTNLTKRTHSPDLRGLFLRGVNAKENPRKDMHALTMSYVELGETMPDSMAHIKASIPIAFNDVTSSGDGVLTVVPTKSVSKTFLYPAKDNMVVSDTSYNLTLDTSVINPVDNNGEKSKEFRPISIGVNYLIRIN